MSATSHDALLEIPGILTGIAAPALEDADPNPTEEIAVELTTELVPAPPRPTAAIGLPMVAYVVARAAAASVAPALVPGAGHVLRNRYVLEFPLGSGGSATVYRAVDVRREADAPEGTRVAVKLLRPEFRDRPECVARLQREFRQTQALSHPNVVRFHDIDCDRGAWFIVMELLSGETLARRLRRAAPAGLAREEALRIALAVGAALAHAHERGVTHGDVKPGNIFMTASGEVRLLDFGLAPGAADAGHRPPVAATRSYASPQVLAGAHAEPADDVFSLACVAYQMLTGVLPRDGNDGETEGGPSALDAPRWQALASALERERARRPAIDALLRALRGESDSPPAAPPIAVAPAVAPAPPASSPVPPKRSRSVAGAAIATCLALLLGIQIGRLDPAAGPPAAAQASPGVAARAQAARAVKAELPESTQAVAKPPAPAGDAAAPSRASAGLVTFDAPTMVVSRRAVVAAIPLRHLTREPRAVEVSWRLVDGTALAGRDYGGPSTGVESFVEGNSFRILYVPIVLDSAATPDRTFVVELTGVSGGTKIGGAARVEVTIQGEA
jgi:tRNA A-37 threonylcarbamoyl transferase component Bud32